MYLDRVPYVVYFDPKRAPQTLVKICIFNSKKLKIEKSKKFAAKFNEKLFFFKFVKWLSVLLLD